MNFLVLMVFYILIRLLILTNHQLVEHLGQTLQHILVYLHILEIYIRNSQNLILEVINQVVFHLMSRVADVKHVVERD